MYKSSIPLYSGFLRSSEEFPDRPALEVNGEVLSYRELRETAASLAATLSNIAPHGEVPLTAVFAHRSATAFASVLAILMRGHGYVPLNPKFPPSRIRAMLEHSKCGTMIVDSTSVPFLEQTLEGFNNRLVILLPEHQDVSPFAERWPHHTFFGGGDILAHDAWEPTLVHQDSIAYILYTSGSTGDPKGVMVAHRNMSHFIRFMVDRYGINEKDRLSQTNDLTFDVSTFDMFVAWKRGACVCCPSDKIMIAPGNFINDARLTIWYSGPSVAIRMRRLGMLKTNQYPGLRLSLFAGEPLPADIAEAWANAAPNSIVENLYGPTELTVTCTFYRFHPQRTRRESEFGWVPIGQPNTGMEALVVDETLREVRPGCQGELLMAGPQVSLGYWRDPQRTAEAFIAPPGKNKVYYRTGDRVRRPIGEDPLVFLGRMDQQVQIHGFRVELGEVEEFLRREAKTDAVVALPWPVSPTGLVQGITAFIGKRSADVRQIMANLRNCLPDYMVPRQIICLEELPLNINGKIDRESLRKILEETGSEGAKPTKTQLC